MTDRRRPFEVVVDGTDGAGKSTCVRSLVAQLEGRGLTVATCAPYRAREVYPFWEGQPVRAARIIVSLMAGFRVAHPRADVVVWDRGWPTAHVSTDDPRALSCFEPRPPLTVLLLGSMERTRHKAQRDPDAGVWDTDEALVRRFHAAYHSLSTQTKSDPTVLRFLPDPRSDWFDLDGIARAVRQVIEANVQEA